MDLIIWTVIHGGFLVSILFLLEEVKHLKEEVKHLNNRIEKLEKRRGK